MEGIAEASDISVVFGNGLNSGVSAVEEDRDAEEDG